MGRQNLSFMENRVITKHVYYEIVSVDTLMKYLHLEMKCMEQQMAQLLPDKVAIIFDGFTSG